MLLLLHVLGRLAPRPAPHDGARTACTPGTPCTYLKVVSPVKLTRLARVGVMLGAWGSPKSVTEAGSRSWAFMILATWWGAAVAGAQACAHTREVSVFHCVDR